MSPFANQVSSRVNRRFLGGIKSDSKGGEKIRKDYAGLVIFLILFSLTLLAFFFLVLLFNFPPTCRMKRIQNPSQVKLGNSLKYGFHVKKSSYLRKQLRRVLAEIWGNLGVHVLNKDFTMIIMIT